MRSTVIAGDSFASFGYHTGWVQNKRGKADYCLERGYEGYDPSIGLLSSLLPGCSVVIHTGRVGGFLGFLPDSSLGGPAL